MKRTTYIMLGMLLVGLLVIIGSVCYNTMQSIKYNNLLMDINGKIKTVQLPECKVVQLVADRDVIGTRKGGKIKDIRQVVFDDTPLKVCPSPTVNSAFTYASDMDKYFTLNTSGDTLRIVFNFSKDKLEEKHKDLLWLNVRSAAMTIALSDSVQLLWANLVHQEITVEGFSRDSLSFIASDCATINECYFKALTVQNGAWKFNTGKADNLHLFLDGINSWCVNADSFHVDTEYLYAFGNQKYTLEKGECRQVIWMPHSGDASLNIKLKEAAQVVVDPE